MTCQQIESLLIPYLDGKLSFRYRQGVELHLNACSSCAERGKGFSEVSGLLEEWKGIEPSAYFNARLEQRIAQETVAASGWENWLRQLAILPAGNPVFAIAMLVVISIAVVLVNHSPAPRQTLASQQSPPVVAASMSGDDEVALYRNMAVLEDFEVLRNFDVLQELSSTQP